MALLDVIEWNDTTGKEMVYKYPRRDIKLGSQLIVHQTQEAMFFKNGQVCDIFGPGRHTLTTSNLPILNKLVNLPFGGDSPFQAEVYFYTKKTFTNLGWGTPTPIPFRDSEFAAVQLRAFGVFAMKIEKGEYFVLNLVARENVFTTDSIVGYLKQLILDKLTVAIAEVMAGKSVLDLPLYYKKISEKLSEEVKSEFSRYGLMLVEFKLGAITPPKEIQELINQRTKFAAVKGYEKQMMAQAMLEAAKNPSGGAGAGLGMGAGIGMGFMMPQMMAGMMGGAPMGGGMMGGMGGVQQQAAMGGAMGGVAAAAGGGIVCPQCKAQNPPNAKFCVSCGAPLQQQPATITCPQCKAQLPAGSKFCPNCGTKLA